MPKVKRFSNSLKSVHASHDVEKFSSRTSPTQSNVFVPLISVQSFSHDISNPLPSDEVQQEQAPTRPANSNTTSKPVPNWRIKTIDLKTKIKTIKLKVHDINNLSLGECTIVDFDEYGATIGASDHGLLARYCETLAIDCNFVSN